MTEKDKTRYRATLLEQKKDLLLSAWLSRQQKKAEIYMSKDI